MPAEWIRSDHSNTGDVARVRWDATERAADPGTRLAAIAARHPDYDIPSHTLITAITIGSCKHPPALRPGAAVGPHGRNVRMTVALSGSIAFDYLMTFPGRFRDHILTERLDRLSLSFLVNSLERRRGGIAPNIAYTLALLGERPLVVGTVGEDFAEYRAWLESAGVDTSAIHVVPGSFTASFFVTTDTINSQIASFYPGAMARAGEIRLADLTPRPELVVISANDPAAMEQHTEECLRLGIPYAYDPSQQVVRMEAATLRRGLQGCMAAFGNDYEFALIKEKTGLTPAALAERAAFVAVTLGEAGAEIYTGGTRIHVAAVPPKAIADPTGVGDAFRGGFLKGFLHGLTLERCRADGRAGRHLLPGSAGHAGSPLRPAELHSPLPPALRRPGRSGPSGMTADLPDARRTRARDRTRVGGLRPGRSRSTVRSRRRVAGDGRRRSPDLPRLRSSGAVCRRGPSRCREALRATAGGGLPVYPHGHPPRSAFAPRDQLEGNAHVAHGAARRGLRPAAR